MVFQDRHRNRLGQMRQRGVPFKSRYYYLRLTYWRLDSLLCSWPFHVCMLDTYIRSWIIVSPLVANKPHPHPDLHRSLLRSPGNHSNGFLHYVLYPLHLGCDRIDSACALFQRKSCNGKRTLEPSYFYPSQAKLSHFRGLYLVNVSVITHRL